MLIVAVLLAIGIVMGAPWAYLLLTAAAWFAPWSIPIVVAWAWWSDQRRERSPDAAFHQAMAASLRAGVGLRAALGEAAASLASPQAELVQRMSATGRSIEDISHQVASALDLTGLTTGAALRMAARTGGAAAESFEALALVALEEQQLADERREAGVQARASALVIAVLALMMLAGLGMTGRIGRVASSGPFGVGMAVAGLGLMVGGLAWIIVLQRQVNQ